MNHCLNEAQEFEREYYDAIEDFEITGEKYTDSEFNISSTFSPQVGSNRLRTIYGPSAEPPRPSLFDEHWRVLMRL